MSEVLWVEKPCFFIKELLLIILIIKIKVKKQQLEPNMEQRTGSKLGKEYVKTVYCYPAYLAYI